MRAFHGLFVPSGASTLGSVKWGTAFAITTSLLLGLSGWVPQHSQAYVPDKPRASSRVCKDGPLRKPRRDCAPSAPRSTGNPYEDCVRRINQLRRKCQCLPPLARWKGGERCADQQAKYDSKKGIHAGFNRSICEPKGLAQNECPGWPSTGEVNDACLQRMWDEGPGRRYAKHGHYINMSNPSYERVACGFAKGRDGKIWSVQNFR